MLSSVINSEKAIGVNLQIIRVFAKMRSLISSHQEVLLKLETLEKKDLEQDEKLLLIFEYLKQLESSKQTDVKPTRRVGYRRANEKD